MRASTLFVVGLGAIANAQATVAPGLTTPNGAIPTDLSGLISKGGSVLAGLSSEFHNFASTANPAAIQSSFNAAVSSFLAHPSGVISAVDGLVSSALQTLSAQAATATGSQRAAITSLIGQVSSAQGVLSTLSLPSNLGSAAVNTPRTTGTSTGGAMATAAPAILGALGGVGIAALAGL